MPDFVTIVRELDQVVQVADDTIEEVVQVHNETVEVVVAAEQGLTGPAGPTGPQGPPGVDGGEGLLAVVDDTSPQLGGDLLLGPYNIIGQLENTDFILDGGLL